jgi:Na+/glutamate symporter
MDHPDATEPHDWIPNGIASGLIGAAVIAVFFLAVDVAHDRPFWTPGALGSALFLGVPLATGVTPQPAVVTAYTALHGAVFVSMGLIASFALLGGRWRRLAAGVAVAVALFAGFELVFLVFSEQLAPEAAGELTGARVTVANLLAAIAMSAVLVRRPAGGWAGRLREALHRAPTRNPNSAPRS